MKPKNMWDVEPIHVHRFKEWAHGVYLPTGERNWSFSCKDRYCLVMPNIFFNGKTWRIEICGCQKCGWHPEGKMTSIMRQNRLRNHRKRVHGV